MTLMIQSMTSSLRDIKYGAGYTTALILLDNQMCELSRKGAIQAGLRETKELTVAGDSLTTYRYSLQTASLDDAANQGITQVDATVAWRSGKKDNAIGLTTLLFAALP